jgi:hypothetical protein
VSQEERYSLDLTANIFLPGKTGPHLGAFPFDAGMIIKYS